MEIDNGLPLRDSRERNENDNFEKALYDIRNYSYILFEEIRFDSSVYSFQSVSHFPTLRSIYSAIWFSAEKKKIPQQI